MESSSGAEGGLDTGELEQALRSGQFVPYIRPRMALDSGRLAGVQVEARWLHPLHGPLEPAAFMDDVAAAGLVGPLLRKLAGHAAAHFLEWHGMGLTSLQLALPLPAQVLADLTLLSQVVATLQEKSVVPGSVTWEVSAAVIAEGQADIVHNLGRLSLRGYGVAAADCGRDELSVRQLACCPLTEITLDGALVKDMAHCRSAIEDLLGMAAQLGVPACCAGVDRNQDADMLRNLGCSVAQGRLIGDAMPAADFADWFRESWQRSRGFSLGRGS